ncbi:MAG: ABC transporter permease [Anaerolineae bacterium]
MAVQTAPTPTALDPTSALVLSRPPRSLWRDAWARFTKNKLAVIASFVLLLFALVAFFAPLLAPHDPLKIYDGKGYLPPAWEETGPIGLPGESQFVFGTDSLGRDVLSRVIYGARVSLVVGIIPAIIILLVGVVVGLIAGYMGGKVDNLTMRFGDVLYAFPDLLFFIIVMTALRDTPAGQLMNGLVLLFVALAIVSWIGLARIVRGQVLSLKEKEFVEAGRMVGAGHARIMAKHILPNCLGPIIVYTALRIPGFIITEAVLGYLGLGLRPSTDSGDIFITSWGAMMLDGQSAINAQPWLLLTPALAVAIVVLAFNFVGDGLRDALDPRLRDR